MKPNKSYKALMVEIEVAELTKKQKPKDMTLSQYQKYLLSLDKR